MPARESKSYFKTNSLRRIRRRRRFNRRSDRFGRPRVYSGEWEGEELRAPVLAHWRARARREAAFGKGAACHPAPDPWRRSPAWDGARIGSERAQRCPPVVAAMLAGRASLGGQAPHAQQRIKQQRVTGSTTWPSAPSLTRPSTRCGSGSRLAGASDRRSCPTAATAELASRASPPGPAPHARQ